MEVNRYGALLPRRNIEAEALALAREALATRALCRQESLQKVAVPRTEWKAIRQTGQMVSPSG